MGWIPPCGKNEGLNALIHAGLALLYGLALVYHATCVKEHLARRDPE